MWQTKYAATIPKNLRLGSNFRLCSEDYFLSGRPQSVLERLHRKFKKVIMGQLSFFQLIKIVLIQFLPQLIKIGFDFCPIFFVFQYRFSPAKHCSFFSISRDSILKFKNFLQCWPQIDDVQGLWMQVHKGFGAIRGQCNFYPFFLVYFCSFCS